MNMTQSGSDINAIFIEITKFFILSIIFYLFSFLFGAISQVLFILINIKTTKTLRFNSISKLNKLPLNYFDTNNIGNTLSRITNDIDTLDQNLAQSFSAIVGGIFMLIGLIISMLITN
jgi:ATP-binding cassette subfamily B protein